MEYKEKFIAFIDILGFTGFVENSELKKEITLDEILEMTQILGLNKQIESCPYSNCIEKDLDFVVTQISDCVIVSSEISEKGVINLLSHCNMIIFKLLKMGILCRGYINKGLVYHTKNQVIGTGYINAHKKESSDIRFKGEENDKGTPFVEVDLSIIDYINNLDDGCIKKFFNRLIGFDGKYTALYPFQSMTYQQSMLTDYSSNKEKKENDEIRKDLNFLKNNIWKYVDKDDKNYEKIEKKVNFYISALNKQLSICDDVDGCIDLLSSPFPIRTIADLHSSKLRNKS